MSTRLSASLSLPRISVHSGHASARYPASVQGRARIVVHAQDQSPAGSSPGSTSTEIEEDKAELAAKLAAAEAEAAALRRELEVRKAEAAGRLSKLKPNNDVFIDGTGFRETIFDGPKLTGKSAKKSAGRSWGFTETELLLSKGSPTEGAGLKSADIDGELSEDEARGLVTRRLLSAAALTAVVLPVALYEIPFLLAPPVKPLYVYVSPLLRLRVGLEDLLKDRDSLDIFSLRQQIRFVVGSTAAVKDNLLSASALLDPDYVETAKRLSFEVLDYLEQADFNNYFESVGAPSNSLQVEYLKFSIKAIETARFKLLDFLSLIPPEALAQARQVIAASRREAGAEEAEGKEGKVGKEGLEGGEGGQEQLGDGEAEVVNADARPLALQADGV